MQDLSLEKVTLIIINIYIDHGESIAEEVAIVYGISLETIMNITPNVEDTPFYKGGDCCD